MIKTLYVIHHSHTDIGYTHGQSRIIRWHGEFIRQAMDIAQRRDDFVWTCETHFPIEEFWKTATTADRERFIHLARSGRIGLSGSFFNFTELPDAPLLTSLAARPRDFATAHGLSLRAAMTADINGTTTAQGRALAAAGVELLVTFIHPHHGYVPLRKRAALYDWDLANGSTLRVLHVDQYHVGNEVGLSPGGGANYMWDWGDLPTPSDDDTLNRRLPRYVARIEAEGWPHDFFVCGVSGLITDNGPPSEKIADRIARWNAANSSGIKIEMVTLDRLADITSNAARPTLKGDCPDWWADGVAGDPEAVALFRHAQRQRDFLVRLASLYPKAAVNLTKLDTSLALFAEHTFGHSGSVRHPANLMAHQLRTRKTGYAAQAADTAEMLTDAAVEAIGCGPLHADRPLTFRAINVGPDTIRELVSLIPDWYDASRWGLGALGTVTRLDTGAIIAHQQLYTHRGLEWLAEVELASGQSVDLRLDAVAPPVGPPPLRPTPPVPDRTQDVTGTSDDVPLSALRTKFVEIDFSAPTGITAWRQLATGRNLLDPTSDVTPFSILASRLPAPLEGNAQCDGRRKLGRNRNGRDAVWSKSTFTRIRATADGPHLQTAELDYELAGCEFVRLKLAAWHGQPRVDVEVVMHKSGTWDSENLYLALPFAAGPDAAIWVDRGAGPMRPTIDQLPGTLVDFLGAQSGLASCGPDFGIAIAQRDSHLLQFGPLEYGIRKLSDDPEPLPDPLHPYVWLMTNYWETNFAPELGGFYSFRFSVMWGDTLRDPAKALAACRAANAGLSAFRLAAT